ncbi:MAG: peptidoglycan editing factor PgeF [Variovorax sp.]|nr:MAG: peptidoglycan editing factor PgeF [Variovorax sp.]
MLIPDWPAPGNVRALCTTRSGGISRAPYESFNLGDHVGDAPQDVAANRARLQQEAGARPVFMQQVHGAAVAELDALTPDGTVADGSTTTASGVACTMMVADCLPVLFTDERGERVAAAHAGWRGLAGGVLEQTFKRFEAAAPVGRAQAAIKVIAWLGPCIGPRAFEVGGEVKAAFEAEAPGAARCFVPGAGEGKWLADLPALARQRLLAMGVDAVYGNDGSDAWCTVNNSSQFFSYRRDAVTGRFAALVWKL